ncbi:MAG TPA: hypothetical protein VIK86_01405 [Candidatus Paceibacterota bacterium]
MIKRYQIEKNYEDYKKWAKEYLVQDKVDLALESLCVACKLAHLYFIKLADHEIEELLEIIGKKIKKPRLYTSELTNRFILYDSVGIDNMALTQQYLRALISWNVEFLYILDDENKAVRARNIINEICAYKKGDLFIVPSKSSNIEKMGIIYNKISEYKPNKAFLHIDVSDVVGVSVWNNFDMITRYFINHADHAFWIGTNCSDYVICYRSMGFNASKILRNIKGEKLLIQPYYPIIKETTFKGLPELDEKYSVKLFSGGRYFKIYGENGEFMKMVAHILIQNPNTVMIFAGDGNDRPLNEFIKEHKFEKRWIVIDYRRDLVELMKNMDIYIGTYPINGGLMAHYAAYCGIPILERNAMNGSVIEDIFPRRDYLPKITFNSLGDYFEEANKLIRDKKYRKWKGNALATSLIKPEEFNDQLKYLLEWHKNKYSLNTFNLDLDKMCKQAIEAENEFLHMYPRKMLNKVLLRKSIICFVISFIIYLKYYGLAKIMIKVKTIIIAFVKKLK